MESGPGALPGFKTLPGLLALGKWNRVPEILGQRSSTGVPRILGFRGTCSGVP